MLNTIWLWILIACSLLSLSFMLLYAYGLLGKWTAPFIETRKERAKAKKLEKQAQRKALKSKASKQESNPSTQNTEGDPMAELQNAVWERKQEKAKAQDEQSQDVDDDDEVRKMTFVTSFHKCLFGVFFAGAFLFLPYYWDYFNSDFLAIRILKMIFMSIHNTVRLFILDGDFEPIQYVIRSSVAIGSEGWLTAARCVYGLYATILYLIAPFMTAGFVLSLFKGLTAYLKYQRLSKADEVYLISELNERSIELAKDIVSEKRIASLPENEQKRKRIVVFAEVFGKNEEKSFELISQAKNLGAYCFKRDVADLGLKRGRVNSSTIQKVYFISEDEDENVEQALIMIESCRKNKKFNTANTHFYVFATTAESEALLDFVDNGNMKVRRVNENKDLAISTLRNYRVFSRAVACKHKQPKPIYDEQGNEQKTIFAREDLKVLRVLIVGLGNYGMELLKTLCWSCQMFSYVLEVYVFDKSGEAKEKMSRFAPDLLRYSEEGDGLTKPYYKIDFTDNADVNSGSFYAKLDKKLPGAVTTVFVTLGEDELNIQTAMGLRSYFGRRVQRDAERREELKKTNPEEEGMMEWQETIPQIFSTVYSGIKNRIFGRNGGLKNNEGKNYGITFIGNMTERYSLGFIEQQALMEAGEKIHCQYSGVLESEELTARIKTMRELVANQDEQAIEEYLQARAQKFAKTVETLGKDIINRANALLKGKDEPTKAYWLNGLALDETTAVEDEIASLEAELKVTPQAILKEARKEDCVGLVKTVEKKKTLSVVRDLFNSVLLAPTATKEERLASYKDFLQKLIHLASERIQKLEGTLKKGKQDYDRYEYFRSSSIATAIHEEFLNDLYTADDYEKLLNEKEEYTKATKEERDEMREGLIKQLKGELEHLRWQAYMWAEGYQKGLYKSSIDKTHHKLVATNQRTNEDMVTSEALASGDENASQE